MSFQETARRRTFAIISHPDAGKTTITEKLLLFGGAIQLAGTVKGRKSARHATSDWMAMEKERGISVTSSVMQFPSRATSHGGPQSTLSGQSLGANVGLQSGGERSFVTSAANDRHSTHRVCKTSPYSPRNCSVTVTSALSRLRQNQPCSPANGAVMLPSPDVAPRPRS